MENQPRYRVGWEFVSKILGKTQLKLVVPGVNDFDQVESVIAHEQDGLDAGITPDGRISDDADLEKVDEVLKKAIDPGNN